MKNLSIHTKILIIAVLPAVLLTLLLSILSHSSVNQLGQTSITLLEQYAQDNSKKAIQDYVDIAVSSIQPIYDNAGADDQEAQKQALAILKNMTFQDGNYIFVYQYDGTNLAFRAKPDKEGQNLINLKDPNGKPVIKDLIDIAKKGGGFYDYTWYNPATKAEEPKLSYAIGLKKWNWMIGTGVYLDSVAKQVSHADEQVESTISSNMIKNTIVTLFGMVALVLIGLWGSLSLSKPIKAMTGILQRVSSGDLSPRSDYQSKDEIGQASSNLNTFLNKISEVISNVAKSANVLSQSAEEVKQVSTETYHSIRQQDGETTSIAAAIEEMSVSAQEIAINGDSVKESANNANQKTAEGAKSVQVNLDSMKRLAGDIDVAADAVSAVEKRTSEIQSMLEVIHSVTEQTNLLALNAAIEAARAGEQGRGFAVVADEVRALAKRSGESAEEIRRIIEGLISDTQSAVGTMMSSRERSEANLEQTQMMAESLRSIEGAITDILEKSAQIAHGTSEQNVVAQEIAQNTSRIKNIARDSAEKMKSTTESSQQLDRLSKDLLKSISFFK